MEAFWLYLHILLLVFWVGTDVGVFIAAKWSEKRHSVWRPDRPCCSSAWCSIGYPAQPWR
ncbi:MAG: hypothetical protein CM15mP74_30630 [Halieaceae bacterium]|nr:MAG: hypothetical protein CM15mP74_30630 [Halieaceae bacterium]